LRSRRLLPEILAVVLIGLIAYAIRKRLSREPTGGADPQSSAPPTAVFTPSHHVDYATDIFPSSYLTLVSIMQGVAVGILATKCFGNLGAGPTEILWPIVPYAGVSLMILVYYTYGYHIYISIFRYAMEVYDVMLPTLLGFSEIVPLFFIDHPTEWWFLTATFCLLGAATMGNTLRHEMTDLPRQLHSTTIIIRWTVFYVSLAFITSVSFTVGGVLSFYGSRSAELILQGLIFVLGAIFLVIVPRGLTNYRTALALERRGERPPNGDPTPQISDRSPS
jgi:hypothetical protein